MIVAWKYAKELTKQFNENNHWRLHSRFDNGINFVNQQNELLFIGSDKNGELPFAIHLTYLELTKLKKQITAESCLYFKDDCFYDQTNPTVQVTLTNCLTYQTTLLQTKLPLKQEQMNGLINLAKTCSLKNGFDTALPTSLKAVMEGNNPLKHAFQQLLSTDASEIEAGLRYYVGRGVGLTPSGDDFLVGLFCLQQAYSILDQQVNQILTNLLYGEQLTTDIGKAYLLAALKGQFSTTLLQLIEELTTGNDQQKLTIIFNKLIQNGHTSGVDTATGLLAGLLIRYN
ncbi:DUF2877 domain-containing protein [Carnobacterium gallinarum]|uniref:DUF2877 domain-containing protein n=1 Tax=Carnobacterium gallinarum TaxID=2749 RepID=UPI00068F572E|nr:DUF2877 domain-containing protein [Carnobacterium gallinarum]